MLNIECTKLTLKLEDLEQNNAELMKENKYLDIENDQQAMEYVQLKCSKHIYCTVIVLYMYLRI